MTAPVSPISVPAALDEPDKADDPQPELSILIGSIPPPTLDPSETVQVKQRSKLGSTAVDEAKRVAIEEMNRKGAMRSAPSGQGYYECFDPDQCAAKCCIRKNTAGTLPSGRKTTRKGVIRLENSPLECSTQLARWCWSMQCQRRARTSKAKIAPKRCREEPLERTGWRRRSRELAQGCRRI